MKKALRFRRAFFVGGLTKCKSDGIIAMGNKYRCIKQHFTDKEHNGKNCPYDNLTTEELSNIAKSKVVFVKYIDQDIKNHYDWALQNGKVSPLVSFETYIEIYESLKSIAIGKIAVDGTMIKHITNHCLDRVCGTTEKENGVKHEGISLQDLVTETVFVPLVLIHPFKEYCPVRGFSVLTTRFVLVPSFTNVQCVVCDSKP